MLEIPVPIRTLKLSKIRPWMGDCLGTPGAADKNHSRAPLRKHVSQADGRQTVSRPTGSGKVWTLFRTACRRLLESDPQSNGNLNGGQPCGVMKMAKSCKEVKSVNQRRSVSEGGMFITQSHFSTWNLR